MAKGLATYGADRIELPNGERADWKQELAKRLLDLQKGEGYWVNDNGRFWEKDPVLVTSYSVLALEFVYSVM
jgi:squalene-hopene/tetraprenyl-beta-curcumene cyclase